MKKVARKRAAAKRTRNAKSVKAPAKPRRRPPPRPTTRAEREAERVAPPPAVCSEQELAFVDEWMGPSRFNGTRAVIAAGLVSDEHPRYAAVKASELLNKAHVLEEIERRRKERAASLAHTAERLLEEQLSVALSSIGDVVRWDGESAIVKPTGTLTAEQLAAIAEIAVIPGRYGDRITVRMHDKLGAIAAIQKQLTPTYQERRRNPDGSPAEGGYIIYVDGGPTGLEVEVTVTAKEPK